MTKVIVCATGLTISEECRIAEALTSLSIEFHKDLDHKVVTHLVVKRVGTPKHKLAIQKALICVSPEWVFASLDAGYLLKDVKSFSIPIFAGLCISVTQIPVEERDRLQRLVESNGGIFTRTLNNPNDITTGN